MTEQVIILRTGRLHEIKRACKDFDLVDPLSPVVDAGAVITDNMLDFFNRTRSVGSAPDIGALEFGSMQEECIPRFPPPLEAENEGSRK